MRNLLRNSSILSVTKGATSFSGSETADKLVRELRSLLKAPVKKRRRKIGSTSMVVKWLVATSRYKKRFPKQGETSTCMDNLSEWQTEHLSKTIKGGNSSRLLSVLRKSRPQAPLRSSTSKRQRFKNSEKAGKMALR